MDYKKRMKIRKTLSWTYIALGILMIAVFNLVKTENSFLSSFGFALFVVGVAQLRRYARMTKDEETMRKYEIAESDERTIAIAGKARGVAFSLYIITACVLSTVLHILEKTEFATILGFSVCFLILVYWISFIIINKKS